MTDDWPLRGQVRLEAGRMHSAFPVLRPKHLPDSMLALPSQTQPRWRTASKQRPCHV